MLFSKGTHIVILGNQTLNAYRYYIKVKSYYEVDCFIKLDSENDKIGYDGIPQYNLDFYLNEKRNASQKIIITLTMSEPWLDISNDLIKKGLKPFEDFTIAYFDENPSKLDLLSLKKINSDLDFLKNTVQKFAQGRKIVFVNGNCQTNLLQQYLCANKDFIDEYLILDLPRICQFDKNNEKLYQFAFENSDIVISQPIKDSNRHTPFLATSNVFNLNHGQHILIPNLTFTGYFPQYYNNTENKLTFGKNPIFSYSDRYIDEMVEQNNTIEEIITKISSINFFDKTFIKSFIKEQLDLFKTRESECDIKMYDFISKNYDKEILFNSFNHPKDFVIKELARRLLPFLNITNLEFENENALDKFQMSFQSQAVYPAVLSYLNIKDDNFYYKPNGNASNFNLNFNDYVTYYCNSFKRKAVTIDVWGSCVSRELFNFTSKINVGQYLLQQPLNTCFGESMNVVSEDIIGTSNFTKRMADYDFNKLSVTKFKENFKGDYLLVDFYDVTNEYFVLQDGLNNKMVTASISVAKTIDHLIQDKNMKFERKSSYEISDEKWKYYLKEFSDLIKSKFSEDRIIINKFNYAEYYLEEKKLLKFENAALYKERVNFLNKIYDFIKVYLPNARYLEFSDFLIGNKNHKIGMSPVHFIDECYCIQNMKLTNLLGLSNYSQETITEAEEELKKSYKFT